MAHGGITAEAVLINPKTHEAALYGNWGRTKEFLQGSKQDLKDIRATAISLLGRGSYTSADWTKLKNSSKITESSTAAQIFVSRQMEERFNPRFINVREARDSEDHPNSMPIMIGLGVCG